MKALTLHQPWASLVALGVKTIETRSWAAPKTLIGQRIAIHAGARAMSKPDGEVRSKVGDFTVEDGVTLSRLVLNGHGHTGRYGTEYVDLPLGAVVCTARLVECLPMVAPGREPDELDCLVVGRHDVGAGERLIVRSPANDFATVHDDQLPYGDFTPGRWAWMLDQIETTIDCPCDVCAEHGPFTFNLPIPAKGRQGLWEWTP